MSEEIINVLATVSNRNYYKTDFDDENDLYSTFS